MKALLFAAFLLSVAAPSFAAEGGLAPGARVRVTLIERHRDRIVGTLLGLPPGAIEIEDSTARSIPRVDVAKLEISRGMRAHTGSAAAKGAVLLGIVGVAVGAGFGGAIDDPDAPLLMATVGGLGGALIGGVLGAAIGSSKTEHWEKVAIP
jgi:hypothetical protein